jgi:hypothetical protein
VAKLKWKCPDQDCPPTILGPVEMKSLDDNETRVVICRSECANEYPNGAIRVIVEERTIPGVESGDRPL